MPYYSELGIYTPSSSYSNSFVKGPYSNHSSILASNILPPSVKHFTRNNFRGYRPHLTTISESSVVTPLQRISSPKLLYQSPPKIKTSRPIKISTADIDVSLNKYTKYDRPNRPKQIIEPRAASPKAEPSSPLSNSPTISRVSSPRNEPKAAKEPSASVIDAIPSSKIQRNRRSIRLQTVYRDTLDNEIKVIKSWRDNFQPDELSTEAKVRKKTPGEILKEKFLVRSKSKENIFNDSAPQKILQKPSIRKSTSFKDICKEISSDQFIENLNPGQPIEVRRRQSKQYSEDILNEIKRSSSTFSVEDVELLDALLTAENNGILCPEETTILCPEETTNKQNKVNKKKNIIRKRSSENLTPAELLNTDLSKSSSSEDVSKSLLENKKSLSQRPISKKVRKSSSEISIPETGTSRLRKDSSLTNMIKDISQVEIEMIPIKPKPLITGSVVEIEVKPNLKAVINDVQIQESPKPVLKKEKRFRFNVKVEELPVKKKIYAKLNIHSKGVVHLPSPKLLVITSILKKHVPKQLVEDLEPKLLSENSQKTQKNTVNTRNRSVEKIGKIKNELQKSKSCDMEPNVSKNHDCVGKNQAMMFPELNHQNITSVCENTSEEVSGGTEPEHLINGGQTTLDNKKDNIILKSSVKTNKNIKEKGKKYMKIKNKNSEQKISGIADNQAKLIEPAKDENDNTIDFWASGVSDDKPPKLGKLKIAQKDPKEILKEIQSCHKEQSDEGLRQKMISKRSLIQKANKEDPDLEVFEPPEILEPEKILEPDREVSPERQASWAPLQNNRLSQWMHPWKKPQQNVEQLDIYAKPKFIRVRHIPRRWRKDEVHTSEEESEDSTSSEETSSDESCGEESEVEEIEGSNKVGASTSSNDSGFHSSRAKDNGSIDSRDSPGLNPAQNPAFALDSFDLPEEVSQSSTYQSFQKSGRITPPATTIPRFRKYCVDDFNFLKVLGKGSFGKVLLAELKGTEYYYAIKCLKKDVVLEDDDVECTLIERKVLALGTKHPYLCHLLCTFQTESHLFFVMEYLNGGDLMFHIQVERRFSEARARFYGAEIVSGLRFLHNKGIVYRDLKLDNILLDFDGHVRIADFGMCKLQIFLDRMADTFCGTPDYMAPEIIKGQHYNQCADWWSFGVLLYEMLLGQSPFSGCDEDELFWSICNEKPVIPRFLSAEASSALVQFLDKDANKRLGNRFSIYGDIQDHPFFKPIDWAALEARQLEPPFKPNLQHPLDTQYFDRTFTTEKAKLTPIENQILQSIEQTQFQGFSYTNPNATDK